MKSFDSSNEQPSPSTQPIAIVGMACRFPGASNISAFWRLLETGQNAVSEGVPGSGVGRWGQLFPDDTVQNESCRYGAFVDDIDLFDDTFFRISPVEAELLDPQQRMMLETSWEALEDAGIDPEGLRESRTGVYTGISNDEYRMLVVDSSKPAEAAGCLYALSGTNLNGASDGCPLCWVSGDRRRQWTLRARHPWYRSTTRWQTCSKARRIWRSPAACRRS